MDSIEQLQLDLKNADFPVLLNEPLAKHTTFRIGGPAAIFCMPHTTAQLSALLQQVKKAGGSFFVLGQGSNVLFKDEGYPGVIVYTGVMDEVTVTGNTIVAGAGAKLQTVCHVAQQHGLSGLEFAYGIPGSIGGAVYMNAGAYGGEMCDVLYSADFIDETGAANTRMANMLELSYRESMFQKKRWCITAATLCLQPGNKQEIEAVMNKHMASRQEKQPLEWPSAGSTFKRPQGTFAAALIDECGLRGYRVGNAAVSNKHCGFVVNLGGATCADVLELADKVADIVKQKTGFTLEKEVRVVEAEKQVGC